MTSSGDEAGLTLQKIKMQKLGSECRDNTRTGRQTDFLYCRLPMVLLIGLNIDIDIASIQPQVASREEETVLAVQKDQSQDGDHTPD